jgi:hypothetical protein
MVRDLEAQELVYRGQGFTVRGADSNAAAPLEVLKGRLE